MKWGAKASETSSAFYVGCVREQAAPFDSFSFGLRGVHWGFTVRIYSDVHSFRIRSDLKEFKENIMHLGKDRGFCII